MHTSAACTPAAADAIAVAAVSVVVDAAGLRVATLTCLMSCCTPVTCQLDTSGFLPRPKNCYVECFHLSMITVVWIEIITLNKPQLTDHRQNRKFIAAV